MARLIDSDTSRLSSVTSQLSAIVEVRCRLWVNALRRKGGTSEFVARILFLPLFAIFGLAPTIGSGAAAWFIFKHNALSSLPLLMWAIFGVWFFIGINAAAGTTGLDLRMLVRFPIRFPTYLIVRLIFGALDMQTVIGLLCLLSAAIGIGLGVSQYSHNLTGVIWAVSTSGVVICLNSLSDRGGGRGPLA